MLNRESLSRGPSGVTLVNRREALTVLSSASAALVVGCSSGPPTGPTPGTPPPPGTTPPPTTTCTVSPNETVGPFPSIGDLIRSDIRENTPGLPLGLTITVVNTSSGCAPVSGAIVDVWQCDHDGNYSQYGGERNATYLRGVQTTDANGRVQFITIYPGWYPGRATHIHVDVTLNGRTVKVTQIAFPEDISAQVYRTGVYASSGQNPTTNSRDGVFSDGANNQMILITGGDTTNGYTGTFHVGVAL